MAADSRRKTVRGVRGEKDADPLPVVGYCERCRREFVAIAAGFPVPCPYAKCGGRVVRNEVANPIPFPEDFHS